MEIYAASKLFWRCAVVVGDFFNRVAEWLVDGFQSYRNDNSVNENFERSGKVSKMISKVHTTNYQNTFIEVAEDCPVHVCEIPPQKETQKSIAYLQYEVIKNNPYQHDSDEVMFHCYAVKNDLKKPEMGKAREVFFSKGQPCFRASPLTKRYGFGIHCDAVGKVALYGVETKEYKKLAADKTLKIVKAMRSKKA
jgi:hypothetical protein